MSDIPCLAGWKYVSSVGISMKMKPNQKCPITIFCFSPKKTRRPKVDRKEIEKQKTKKPKEIRKSSQGEFNLVVVCNVELNLCSSCLCVCVCVVLLPSFLPSSSSSSSSEYSAKVNHKLCAVGVGLQSRLALLIFLYIHRVRLTDCLSFFIFCLFVCLCALCVPACLPAFPLLSISVLLC